jgi:Sec-independent protein secretion pathway component TatC
MIAADRATGLPTWLLVVSIALFAAGAVFAGLIFRRTGAGGAWSMITGRSGYRPHAAIYVGMAGIVLAAILHAFWIAIVVVVPVILFGWWRFWGASSRHHRDDS